MVINKTKFIDKTLFTFYRTKLMYLDPQGAVSSKGYKLWRMSCIYFLFLYMFAV
jgi:hypothetical protein